MSKIPSEALENFGAFRDWLTPVKKHPSYVIDDVVWATVARITKSEREKGHKFTPLMVYTMGPEKLMLYYLMFKEEQGGNV